MNFETLTRLGCRATLRVCYSAAYGATPRQVSRPAFTACHITGLCLKRRMAILRLKQTRRGRSHVQPVLGPME